MSTTSELPSVRNFESSLENFPGVEQIRGCECTFTGDVKSRQDYVTGAMVCADKNCLVLYTETGAPYGYHDKWGGWKWSSDKKDIIVRVSGHGMCTIHNVRIPS